MSNSENLGTTTRSNFASRLLNRELTDRTKKTTLQLSKINPADAAKYAAAEKAEEKKEVVAAAK
ncbi:MAG: hypothetical protein K2W95_28325 [Candidatus Obscuribacterales bacterium]|nr:hypothetical protein [Candidatus Obscuribacterales bacterium]